MNVYVLRAEYDNGAITKTWSHSKLEMIDNGQRLIRGDDVLRAVVFRVSYEGYESPRQLVVKILNKSKVKRTIERVWQQKKQPTEPVKVTAIEPITGLQEIVPNV